MVFLGNLSPDPSDGPDENFLPRNINVIPLMSSDSEEEEVSYEGYQVLPQDFMESNNIQQDDSDSQESSNDEANETSTSAPHAREISAFDAATTVEVTELWNSTSKNRPVDIVMDSNKEEQIKNAMAGFQLPSTSIPSWAESIPEEEWKEQLLNRVNLLNKVTAV